ncbi:hypothetical protein HPB50_007398 [Hyalomma asiaticum]|uniref:Uncharacterized protein n=1 Tax=Hyalomma asiaticum TaxID=266040 RepID=A0ACB7S0Y0_HYAAI|nr:hypothetical protein HPB50_007398 [Hyalomma asiaticum]
MPLMLFARRPEQYKRPCKTSGIRDKSVLSIELTDAHLPFGRRSTLACRHGESNQGNYEDVFVSTGRCSAFGSATDGSPESHREAGSPPAEKTRDPSGPAGHNSRTARYPFWQAWVTCAVLDSAAFPSKHGVLGFRARQRADRCSVRHSDFQAEEQVDFHVLEEAADAEIECAVLASAASRNKCSASEHPAHPSIAVYEKTAIEVVRLPSRMLPATVDFHLQ